LPVAAQSTEIRDLRAMNAKLRKSVAEFQDKGSEKCKINAVFVQKLFEDLETFEPIHLA
jgi:hypothetical protein